ncbi:MAG: S1C family serine protease [Treponema sp.]|nr:S1C family serine protease [Treponema sp.]
MTLKSGKYLFVLLIAIFTLASCRTIKQPKEVAQPINYSDEDVVNIEIERINNLLQAEPVKALWRSLLLGREDVIERCKSTLILLFENAMEEKDYFTAKKYYKSLITSGWKSEKYTNQEVEKLYSQTVPGFQKNNKAPKSIADCMDATVTIWVDRGIKVVNGAGYADVVLGSGFFIDERGYLITNHHVIDSMVNPKYEGYSRLYIKLLDDPDTKIPAKVIGYDPILDLALLKVEITPEYVLDLGSSKDLNLGDKVSAIGTPVGLEGTLTSGIISSTERKLFTLGNVFQIDAAVNSGNSGGPLIDQNLKVQAIVFAGISQYQGLNFAIPVEYLRQELSLLYKGDELQHAWIGASGNTKRYGNKKVGLEVQYVLPGGSSSMSGLKPGCVITQIDGFDIKTLEDFQYLMMAYDPETLLTCKYLDEEEKEAQAYIYLDKRPESPSLIVYESDFISNAFVPLFGMKLVASSTLNRNSYTIENVIKGSVADQMNFSEYDIVQIRDIKLDKENEYIFAQILTRRRKKGFLDISMGLSTAYDSPYYF